MSEHDSGEERPRRRLWLYSVLVLLAAISGGIGWFLGAEKSPGVPAPQPQVAHAPATIPEKVTPPAVTPAASPNASQPENAVQLPRAKSAETAAQPANTIVRNEPVEKTMKQDSAPAKTDLSLNKVPSPKEQNQTSKSSKDMSEPPPARKAVPGKRIYSISELPEEIRGGLPALSISTHIYSQEKSERLASINGHIGREGQEIFSGVRIDSIVPDGAILSYQGYRFKIGLK